MYQIFRTLLFHFGTDNFVPIQGTAPKHGIASFVKNLLQRPCNSADDEAAEARFYNSLVTNLKNYAMAPTGADSDKIQEEKFCELMRTFNTSNSYEFSDED